MALLSKLHNAYMIRAGAHTDERLKRMSDFYQAPIAAIPDVQFRAAAPKGRHSLSFKFGAAYRRRQRGLPKNVRDTPYAMGVSAIFLSISAEAFSAFLRLLNTLRI